MFSILKNYMNFGVIYHFYQKINKILKIERLLANLLDKFQYHIHMKILKQPLNHGLVLKKVKLNKTAWLNKKLLAIEIRKTQILPNKFLCLNFKY